MKHSAPLRDDCVFSRALQPPASQCGSRRGCKIKIFVHFDGPVRPMSRSRARTYVDSIFRSAMPIRDTVQASRRTTVGAFERLGSSAQHQPPRCRHGWKISRLSSLGAAPECASARVAFSRHTHGPTRRQRFPCCTIYERWCEGGAVDKGWLVSLGSPYSCTCTSMLSWGSLGDLVFCSLSILIRTSSRCTAVLP